MTEANICHNNVSPVCIDAAFRPPPRTSGFYNKTKTFICDYVTQTKLSIFYYLVLFNGFVACVGQDIGNGNTIGCMYKDLLNYGSK